MCASIALGVLGAVSSLAQFVPAPTDLTTATGYADVQLRYKEVPTGICELDPNVKSYSGYADVEEDQHIFWWFFEARDVDPTTAPLSVWINGGPGSSSMIGLWQELGPCGVDYQGNVYSNPYSWTNVSNYLFIDQPTQVGFSYSVPIPAYADPDSGDVIALPNNTCPDFVAANDTCGTWSQANYTLTANSTASTAPNMWKTLQGFMGVFPQYSRNLFHFTTESYGGHYGPVMNEYFETQNAANIPGAHPISIQSVAIGNGWYSPLIQYQAYYNYTVSPGNPYNFSPYNGTIAAQLYNALYAPGNCVDRIADCYARGLDYVCRSADDFCATYVESVLDSVANRDEYDIRELQPDPFPYGFFTDYLNTPGVQAAIGAYTNYSESSSAVADAFDGTGDDGRESMTIEDIRALLDQGVNVMLYAGDADYNCNYLGGQVIADEVAAPGYASTGYTDLMTSDNITHGQVRQAGNFSFVRVYYSGHEVPFYQPLASLEMFERQIAGRDIATGRVGVGAGYSTSGPPTSGFVEGSGTVQFSVLDPDATYNYTTATPNNSSMRRGLGEGMRGAKKTKLAPRSARNANVRREKPVRARTKAQRVRARKGK